MSTSARFSSLEPLESRIAPALLVVGANLLGGENPKTGEGSVGADSVTMIKVLSGSAVAWYDGLHITAVSFGPNTTLDLTGDVGELIGNLMPNGRLSDSDGDPSNGEDGNVLLPNNLLGVTTHALSEHLGDIGNIITGGSISSVNVHGHLSGVYAGDGAFRTDSAVLSLGKVTVDVSGAINANPVLIHVNPLDPTSATGFTFTQATSKLAPGASISKLNVAIAEEMQVFAGNGGLGLPASSGYAAFPANSKGGSISTVHITSAFIGDGADSSTPSYYLHAGDGANGTTGGAGGSIIGVLEETSNNIVIMQAGKGGIGSAGPGGAGGNVQSLDLQSDSSAYKITAGDGGHGTGGGGAGGSVTQTNFSGKKPNTGVILAADFTGDGFEDVLVADSNTGNMVIAAGSSTGVFTNVVQYVDPVTNKDVVLIESAGSTPSSAVAVDVDGDGDLDLVIAYKNSSTLGVFLNTGHGSFYDTTTKNFQSSTIPLQYSPEKLLVGNFGDTSAQDLAIIENDQGHGKVQIATGDGAGKFSAIAKFSNFSSVLTSAAVTHSNGLDTVFVSNTSGTIYALNATGNLAAPLADAISASAIAGGVATMDVNSTSTELVAVAGNGTAVNVYGIAFGGMLVQTAALDLSGVSGRPVNAHFVADNGKDALNSIALLSVAGSGSQISLFTAADTDGDPNTVDTSYTLGRQLNSTESLKNFVPVYNYNALGNVSGFGVAALSGSLSQFTFSPSLSGSSNFALPFTGKSVIVTAGGGGAGDGASKGGLGGSVFAMNADATVVIVEAGHGGNSDLSAAGKGGSISNPASFVTLSGVVVVPALSTDTTLQLTAGTGGSVLLTPGAGQKGGAGGAGGAISSLTLSLAHNEMDLSAGDGGTGRGLGGGAGGSVSGIIATNGDGGVKIKSGTGGDAKLGNYAGGNGGAISGVKFSLAVGADDATHEATLGVSFIAGPGGKSAAGVGGAGGALSGITATLNGGDISYDDPLTDPPKSDTHLDSTISVLFQSGIGGDGTTGGAGGNITGVTSQSIFDQVSTDNELRLNFVVLTMTAGDGGTGSFGTGGPGGSISLKGAPALAGITSYDNDSALSSSLPLNVTSGSGGPGKTKGGAGGAISGLVVQNAKFSPNLVLTPTQLEGALISSGHGGSGDVEGGRGGDISGLQIGTQYGALVTKAGYGGAGAKGGQGGSVSSSTLATVGGGIIAMGGTGGQGTSLGGKGGALSKLTINAPQYDQDGYAGFFGGDGGAATASGGIGGEGGSISGITQMKDLNSAIDIIEAGNGGAAASGTGGKGGSVSGIKTVGFIGRPTDGVTKLGAFDASGDPQGLFSGRGGAGTTNGTAGGVTSIVARQIAAISAAYDTASQTFAIASIVSGVKADVIGYDVNYDPAVSTTHVFNTTGADGLSPAFIKPIDGFILAGTISGITGSAPFQFNS